MIVVAKIHLSMMAEHLKGVLSLFQPTGGEAQ